jgi:malonyl-ACP decarboxylase
MKNCNPDKFFITGVGITSAVGQGKTAFMSALLKGQHAFKVMQRPGRQTPVLSNEAGKKIEQATSFLGAEILSLCIPESLPKKALRTASLSSQVALITLHEAWDDANLGEIHPARIGLVVGGSNFQQRELINIHETFQNRSHFVRPTYGITFMDSDLCGLCTELFGIQGFAYTVGGASASGQLAIVQAIQAVQSGQVDICIAMGALMDLSYWECQGFRSLGAMGSDRYATDPKRACRPFDEDRDGFIYGESCGAVVIEGAGWKKRSGAKAYARITGWAVGSDGNRNPNPCFEGEVGVIQSVLKQARLTAEEIDYINPHGTGSVIGDGIELQALGSCNLTHAYLNATKSITGHGLSAAGTVEVIATLLQMEAGRLHSTRNLKHPMDPSFNWVRHQSVQHNIKHALNLSIGFGGINSAIGLENDSA